MVDLTLCCRSWGEDCMVEYSSINSPSQGQFMGLLSVEVLQGGPLDTLPWIPGICGGGRGAGSCRRVVWEMAAIDSGFLRLQINNRFTYSTIHGIL